MARNLAGKVAVATGTSSGIGRALANTLAAEGVKLVLVGRSAERLQEVAKNLSAAESLVLPVDLARPAEVERVASEALARFGRIDILLANAGLYKPGKVAEGNADTWDEMLAVMASLLVSPIPDMSHIRENILSPCRTITRMKRMTRFLAGKARGSYATETFTESAR